MKKNQQIPKKRINKTKPNANSIKWIFDYLPIISLFVLIIIVYFSAINNEFILNWDDSEYIHANPYIKDFSFKGIIAIFSNYFFANYHPLTTLTYLIEYQSFGLNPIPIHFTNIIIHSINTYLVFFLFKKISANRTSSFIIAFIFALHPMHVESVAWISERKDLLYTFFFLLSLIKYIDYISNSNNLKPYWISLLFFIISLLSKSAAAVLAPLLFLIDYWYNIPINRKSIINKIPFFLLAITFGIIAIISQQKELKNLDLTYNFLDRILLVTYSASFYIIKFFAPIKLSVFYPYPEKINGYLPLVYYLSPLLPIILVLLVYKLKNMRKILLFGLGFYLISMLMVLQIVPVGKAITAERYSYIPYLGLSFIIALMYNNFLNSPSKVENNIAHVLKYLLIGSLVVFTYLSFERVKIWKDDISVFTDASIKYEKVDFLHNNLGVAYYRKNQFAEAIVCYDKAIKLNNKYEGAYYNRGNCKYNLNDYINALKDYDKAIELDPKYTMAYSNRCTVKSLLKDNNSALIDCSKAISLDSNFADAYLSRGCIYLDIDSINKALKDFDMAIKLRPDNANNYYNRANAKIRLSDTTGSMHDYNKAIEINSTYSKAYYNRASIYYRMGKKNEACNDWKSSLDNGYQPAQTYFNQFCK